MITSTIIPESKFPLLDRLVVRWNRFVSVNVPNEEDARLGRLFTVLMVISTGIVIVLSITFLIMPPLGFIDRSVSLEAAAFPAFFIPLSIFCMIRSKRGHIQSSISLYVWINFIAIGVAAWLFDGVYSPAWILYIWTITIAGTLLAPLYALLMTCGVVAYFFLLLILSHLSIYAPPLTVGPVGREFLDITLLMIMLVSTVGILTYLNMTSLQQAFRRLRNEVTERKQAELHLRESEEKFRSVFDEALDIIFTVSTDTIFRSLNPAFEIITGWNIDDWLRKPFPPLLHPADLPKAMDILKRVMNGVTVERFELRVRKSNGKYFIGEFTVSLLDHNGTKVLLGICRDVTEKRKMIDALYESEMRFRTVADHTYDWEYWLGPDGKFIYVSPSCERITGYKPENFSDNPEFILSIIHADDREKLAAHFRNTLRQDSEIHALEFRIIAKDGSVRWINHNCQPIVNVRGEWWGRHGTNRDITDERRMETSLRASEERHRSFLETARDIIFTLSPDGIITSLNRAFEESTGWPRSEWVGRHFGDGIVHPDDWQFAVQTVQNMFRGEIPPLTEIRVRTKWGAYILGEFVMMPQVHGGIVTEVLGIGRDITGRRRIEEALRRSEEKYRKIFENVQDVFFLTDHEGKITDISPSIERYSGFSREELIGKSVIDVYMNPDDTKELVRAIARTGEVVDYEARLKSKDDRLVYTSVNAHLIYSTDKSPVGMEGSMRDITERKKIETVLREREAHFHAIAASANDAIISADSNGTIMYWNEAASRMFGYSSDEAVGQQLEILMPLKYREAYRIRMANKQVMGSQSLLGKTVEMTALRKDGSNFPVEHSVSGWTTPDGLYFTGILRDITDRKRAEQDREKLIGELQESLANIKTLSGLLPICSSCKKIRDDKGYWNQLEKYLKEHTEVQLTHGICPDCMQKYFPGSVQDEL